MTDVAAALAPLMAQLPKGAAPRFLALLEREAAARYRAWAGTLPQHATALLECSDREEEVASRVAAVLPVDAAAIEQMHALLPTARAGYDRMFVGIEPSEQLRMQAAAELQGAAAWRRVAAHLTDPATVAELEICATLEEANATAIGELLAQGKIG